MPVTCSPQECTTMVELRAQIDLLDKELVGLLALRARYIDQAAAIKANIGLAARLEDRVEAVVSHVRECAKTSGLDPALAENLWRDLIDWSISQEEEILNKDPKRG